MAWHLFHESHHTKQQWLLINHIQLNILQWKKYWNWTIFIDEIVLKIIVCNFVQGTTKLNCLSLDQDVFYILAPGKCGTKSNFQTLYTE